MALLKTVLHVHTDYSADSNVSPEQLVATAHRQGIDCVAVTDHNVIAGALAVRAITDRLRVIVGEEITTADGHLLGLFLDRAVPPFLSAESTIERIRGQGGLVFAPHPFACLCENSLGSTIERIAPLIDAVEIHNSQNPFWWEDARAARFTQRQGLTAYVGADAHVRGYLAASYQMVPDFDGPQSLLNALREAEFHLGRFGPRYTATMAARQVWRRFVRRPLGGFGANVPRERNADGIRTGRPVAGRTHTR
jgi:predicted metal-dependent phosphoesterase TrpH